jgi:hypothetical protein
MAYLKVHWVIAFSEPYRWGKEQFYHSIKRSCGQLKPGFYSSVLIGVMKITPLGESMYI